MSEPILTPLGGTYRLVWEDHLLTITVDRLVDHRDTLTAEVTVTSQSPVVQGHLHGARLNLTSTTARATLSRALRERIDWLPWSDIIEQTCVLVLRKHREGEPVVNLAEVQQPESSAYRLEPLLVEGKPNLLFGSGGLGKSMLGIYTAALVASGVEDAKFNPEPGNVLYLDWEDDQYELHARLKLIAKGFELGDLFQ